MLRDPLAVKKFLADHMWSKIFAKPEKSGTTCPHLGVCVSVCVCDCESECVEERRCGVVTLKSPKKNT